ncbi:hypothetical protein LZ32DRAFT_610228 [Colletotrichum eremochloae]|nr:hypothetical protein LZ32DRAFT_610228 [Colletotrichum eremochloae]
MESLKGVCAPLAVDLSVIVALSVDWQGQLSVKLRKQSSKLEWSTFQSMNAGFPPAEHCERTIKPGRIMLTSHTKDLDI